MGTASRLSRSCGPLANAGASCASPTAATAATGAGLRNPSSDVPSADGPPRHECLFPRSESSPGSFVPLALPATDGGRSRSSCSRSSPNAWGQAARDRDVGGSVLSAVSTNFRPSPASIVPGLWKELVTGGPGGDAAEASAGDAVKLASGASPPPSTAAVETPSAKAANAGVAFSRGLRWQDVRMTNETGPAVCYVREIPCPQIPDVHAGMKQKERNIAYLQGLLGKLGVDTSRSTATLTRGPQQVDTMTRRAASESTLATTIPPVILPAVVARNRYQTFVVGRPRTPVQAVATGPPPCRAGVPVSPPTRRWPVPHAPATGTAAM
eukprot:TRINITY_DN55055_c0_g1_i1.p1 TRINITY_DN55055_c0_g1~~TRINITY_DN55055_c0_g1_i1.p1  ORF type:complete len:325 (+),score=39.75 TRINITY_DN55055_c0_g1_i1:322-1296(+)